MDIKTEGGIGGVPEKYTGIRIGDEPKKALEVPLVNPKWEQKVTQKRNICIFLTTGRTFSFRNVIVLSDNETAITFEYTAMSDSLGKTATFFKAHVAGISFHYSEE